MFIEQIMIFALGFLCAGLLTLLFLPAFWRRAMTLSRRQIEMQIPLSMAEVVAERDQLRAEFAAEQRKLEQRLEAVNDQRARERVELGERGIVAAGLVEQLASVRTELQTTTEQLASAKARISATEAEFATSLKQLYDAEGALDQRRNAFDSLSATHAALQMQSDEQRAAIAGLETRLSGKEADAEALDRDVSLLQVELEKALAEQKLLAHERDQFRSDAQNARSRREALQQDYEAQGRRVEELQNTLRAHEREKVRMTSELADTTRLLDEERRRARDLSARVAEHNAEIRALERKAAADAELARAGKAALDGALAAQRRENETARAEIARLREELRASRSGAQTGAMSEAGLMRSVANDTGAAPEFPALRKTIANLGQEIARIAVALEESRQASQADRPSAPRSDAAE